MVKPSEVLNEVQEALEEARSLRGSPMYITSYQVLQWLDEDLRDRLISERGKPGKGAGSYHSAASIVSKALRMLEIRGNVEIAWLDSRNLRMLVAGQEIKAGNYQTALYRIVRRRARKSRVT